MEAGPGVAEELTFFYADVLGLEPVDGERGTLCFETQRMQVRFVITPDAEPSPMRRRLVLQISSLERMRGRLDEFEVNYEWHQGMQYTDRRIDVLDPADNRIELRQSWPL